MNKIHFALCLLVVTNVAQAQGFFDRLFGTKPTGPSVQARWNCPQEVFPSVQQLKNVENISVSFSETAGVVKANLQPNIFKSGSGFFLNLFKKNSPLSIDYGACLSVFQRSALNAITEYKKKCAGGDNPLCTKDSSVLVRAIDNELKLEKVFQTTKSDILLPPMLPGSSLIRWPETEVKNQYGYFCKNGWGDRRVLFSDVGLKYAKNSLSDECRSRLSSHLINGLTTLRAKSCPLNKDICERINQSYSMATSLFPGSVTMPEAKPNGPRDIPDASITSAPTTSAQSKNEDAPTSTELSKGVTAAKPLTEEQLRSLDCSEVPKGQNRIIGDGKRIHPTREGVGYAIKRTAEGKYEIVVGLSVTQQADGVTGTDMMKRIQSCVAESSTHLFPAGQAAFKLRVVSPGQEKLDGQLPIHAVKVVSSKKPMATGSFRSDATCGVILHHIMHYLGVSDEFFETIPDTSCRSIPPDRSLMSSHENGRSFFEIVPQTFECECKDDCKKIMDSEDDDLKAFYLRTPAPLPPGNCTVETITKSWNSLSNKRNFENMQLHDLQSDAITITLRTLQVSGDTVNVTSTQHKCQCPAGDTACRNNIKFNRDRWLNPLHTMNSCPKGSRMLKESVGNTLGDEPYEFDEHTLKIAPQVVKKGSLLRPAHVARILAGNCINVPKRYNECAIWAEHSEGQESSNPFLKEANKASLGKCQKGSGRGNPNCFVVKCENRPAYCDEASTYSATK